MNRNIVFRIPKVPVNIRSFITDMTDIFFLILVKPTNGYG